MIRSVSDDKAAAAAAFFDNHFSIECLPNRFSVLSAKLHALYRALRRMETPYGDERNFNIFSDPKSALQAIWGLSWTHSLVLNVL